MMDDRFEQNDYFRRISDLFTICPDIVLDLANLPSILFSSLCPKNMKKQDITITNLAILLL